jgi:1,4-alpha-glucan branching enzyme
MTKQWALGAVVHSGGVHFRVWAPFADGVRVMGDFNDWDRAGVVMEKADDGTWAVNAESAAPGQEYKFIVQRGDQLMERNDPRALQLSNSGENSIIVDPGFDWGDDFFQLPSPDKLLLYEMHVGTFNRHDAENEGTFGTAIEKLDYLSQLGVNAIEVMPVNAVWDEKWWGYTPVHLYAIEAAYGGRHEFLRFVKAAHERGIGVIADVIYNHLSVVNNNLWKFDGWSENDKGGVYFYNDWRSENPWGDSRLDYGRPEVRDYILDNARMLMDDCHLDGLRVDATMAIRKIIRDEFNEQQPDNPDGWHLLQGVSGVVKESKKHSLSIAEDLQGNEWLTKQASDGGAGFNAQWDVSFAACVREVLDPIADESRDLEKIRYILNGQYNSDPWQRIIFTESHDTDAKGNKHTRFDEEISPGNATNYFARKRTTLATGLLLTAPGVPMLFQGQEFMETGAFDHWRALTWKNVDEFMGVVMLYKHLIKLRRNAYGNSAGLLGAHINVFMVDTNRKLLAFHRWDKGGAGDDTVIVANFSNNKYEESEINFAQPGLWRPRFNSDWNGYSDDFSDVMCPDVQADGEHNIGKVTIGPYSLIILSQDS